MTPNKRSTPAPKDPFEDETTAQYDPGAVPQILDDETTMPVSVDEMTAAARASRHVQDPDEPPRIIRRDGDEPPSRSEPYAEVQVAGSAQVVVLPAHNLSPTGIALAVPDGVPLSLREGTTVMVDLHMGKDEGGSPMRERLPARVAHHRLGGRGRPGGLALRWDTDNPSTVPKVERLLARAQRA